MANRESGIGYMKGTIKVAWLSVLVLIVTGVWSHSSALLWVALACEMISFLALILKIELEKFHE